MGVQAGLEWTFDTVVSAYDKMRPGYAGALHQAIFAYRPVLPSSRVVEVGIGAGQATLPFLQTGCQLTAVEYGKNFSSLCKEKFKAYPNFSVITGRFEEVTLEENAYDLVYAATAFHWVPEEAGYPKVFSMLKSGGAFARFANHPFQDKGNPSLAEEIQRLYGAYYYKFHNTKTQSPPQEYTEEQAAQLAQKAARYGFTDVQHALFHRTRTFTPKEYTALLSTYSDHIAMEEPLRLAFYAEIENAINRHGGTITLYDTMDLQLARKP